MVKESHVSYPPEQLSVLNRHECHWHKVTARNPRTGLVEAGQYCANGLGWAQCARRLLGLSATVVKIGNMLHYSRQTSSKVW